MLSRGHPGSLHLCVAGPNGKDFFVASSPIASCSSSARLRVRGTFGQERQRSCGLTLSFGREASAQLGCAICTPSKTRTSWLASSRAASWRACATVLEEPEVDERETRSQHLPNTLVAPSFLPDFLDEERLLHPYTLLGLSDSCAGLSSPVVPRVEQPLVSTLSPSSSLTPPPPYSTPLSAPSPVPNSPSSSVGQHCLASVTQSPPPMAARSQDDGLGNNYHVNVGYAIRTLREELPTMFYKEMSYSIYRDDITFQDPLNTFQGIKNYRTIFWALRFHGRIFFKALWVDVNRVWQPNEHTITIRWSVRGVPRVPWEARGRFDGTSEYKLDKEGKIYAHKVDNVVLSDPPRYQPLTVMELLQLSGIRSTPGITCSSSLPLMANGREEGLTRRAREESLARLPLGQALRSAKEGGKGPSKEQQTASTIGSCGGLLPVPSLSQAEPAVGPQAKEQQPPRPTRGMQPVHLWLLPSLLALNSFSWFRFYVALSGTLALRQTLEPCF